MRTLYTDHLPWLQGLLRKRLGNRHDAADLAQDTFVRVLAAPERIAAIEEPRRYLAVIARGLVVDLFRRRALEQAYLDYLAALPEQLAPSPEEQALAREALLQVDRLLAGLPPKVRHAFLLAQCEELPYAEIASRLGISLRSVHNHLARAMAHCCAALA